MKTWIKILMWVGLGGGIGFFAGLQVGSKRSAVMETEHWEAAYNNGRADGYAKAVEDNKNKNAWEEVTPQIVKSSIKEYRGDFDGDRITVIPEEDPPMVEEPPVIGDEEDIEDVPQLHPQHMIPVQITEDEYYANPWGYDQESLIFYEMDEVLFNKDTLKAMTTKDEIDQVIGLGMTFNFYLKDGETLDVIFVKNDTMGVIFRIDRIDAAYQDEGADPEYEEEDID